jgi:hypothetical protein
MADEPVHEAELIGVLLGVRRIAVRQIDAGDSNGAGVGRDNRLDIARLRVGVVARQAAGDLERAFGEDGDAVEPLLPVRLDVIAEVLDFEARKLLVEALDLLQAERVRARLLQVVEEVRKPLAYGIDVPGCDAQRRAPVVASSAYTAVLKA